MFVERDTEAVESKGASARHALGDDPMRFNLPDNEPRRAVARSAPSADGTDPAGRRRARDGRGPGRG
jgi:hypothetical protein